MHPQSRQYLNAILKWKFVNKFVGLYQHTLKLLFMKSYIMY